MHDSDHYRCEEQVSLDELLADAYRNCGNCGATDLVCPPYHTDSYGRKYAHCPHCADEGSK